MADTDGRFEWTQAVTASELSPKAAERLRVASEFPRLILLIDEKPALNQVGQLTPRGRRLGKAVEPALTAMKSKPRPLWRQTRSVK